MVFDSQLLSNSSARPVTATTSAKSELRNIGLPQITVTQKPYESLRELDLKTRQETGFAFLGQ